MKSRLLLLLVVCFILLSACASGSQADFSEDRYNRESAYGVAFDTIKTERNGITYSFEKSACTEEEAVKYVDQINSDIVTIYNALSEIESISLQKKLDIYVVKSLVNHEQIIDGQNIFLDIASITDCSYRSLLLRAMLGMGDCVKIYGLSGYIFNINGDLNYVQDSLSSKRGELDLFIGRTNPSFATKEEIELFRNVAILLSRYVIEKKGLTHFVQSSITTEDIDEWLKYIDVSAAYDKESIEYQQKFEGSYRDGYDMVLKYDQTEYAFHDCGEYFTDISEVEDVLLANVKLTESIPLYWKEHNLTSYDFEGDINHILYDIQYNQNAISQTVVQGHEASPVIKILSQRQLTFTHEFMHVCFNCKDSDRYWMEEGLCEYFAFVEFCPEYMKEGLYQALCDETYQNGKLKEYYEYFNGTITGVDTYNLQTVYNYYIYQLDILHQQPEVQMTNSIGSINGYKGTGDELNYMEAMTFAGYLVHENGIDKIVEFLSGTESYEDFFGSSYENLKSEWLNSISLDLN